MEAQGQIWYRQWRLENAKSEGLDAFGIFERLGAALGRCAGRCKGLIRGFEKAVENWIPGTLDSGGGSSSHSAISHPC